MTNTDQKRRDAILKSKVALEKAIRVVGTQAALARKMGPRYRQQNISHWLKNGVPAEHCPAIERATGGKVRRRDIRPDVFDKPGDD